MPKIWTTIEQMFEKKGAYRRYDNTNSLKSNKQDNLIADLSKNIT